MGAGVKNLLPTAAGLVSGFKKLSGHFTPEIILCKGGLANMNAL